MNPSQLSQWPNDPGLPNIAFSFGFHLSSYKDIFFTLILPTGWWMNESAKKKAAGAKKYYLFELKATGASSPLPSCILQYNTLAAVLIHLASLVLCSKLCWWQNRFPSLLVATNGVTIAVLYEAVQNKMKVSFFHRVQDFLVSAHPRKCLFRGHGISVWNNSFHLVWVIQHLAPLIPVVLKMSKKTNF